MKVLLAIWITAVLIQEVIPSTLVRLPRHEPNKTAASVHTEYEAKYEQKGKNGNESVSSVTGKQHFLHDNCSENWNAFAEKCAALIKGLVASLANVVASKPGDATNLQLHIKNTFRHFDNTQNCTCLNHTDQGLSDLDLSPLFSNITISTVSPPTNDDSGNNNKNNCGKDGPSDDEENGSPSNNNGDNDEPDQNQSHKGSDKPCAGDDKKKEKGTEAPTTGDPFRVIPKKRKPDALIDAENLDMHPSTNSNDQSANNSRRQAKYPQISRQPKKSSSAVDSYPPSSNSKHPKSFKQILYPVFVTPRPSKPLQGSNDSTSAFGHSPDGNPLSLPEDKSSGGALVSPVSSSNKGNVTPSSASHFITSPGDSDTSPNLPSNHENSAPNHSAIGQQPTQTEIKPMTGNETKLPVPVISSHNSNPDVVTPITDTQNSKPAIAVPVEPIIKKHNLQPLLVSPTGPATDNHNTNPAVIVPVQTSDHNSEALTAAPVKKKEPSIPVINSNSNIPEPSEPENEDEKSVNESPTSEPIPTSPSPHPSNKAVTGTTPKNLSPDEDSPDKEHNKECPTTVANDQPGETTDDPGNPKWTTPVTPIPVKSSTVQPTSPPQKQTPEDVFVVTPIPGITEAPPQEATGITPLLIYPVASNEPTQQPESSDQKGPGDDPIDEKPSSSSNANSTTASTVTQTDKTDTKVSNTLTPVTEAPNGEVPSGPSGTPSKPEDSEPSVTPPGLPTEKPTVPNSEAQTKGGPPSENSGQPGLTDPETSPTVSTPTQPEVEVTTVPPTTTVKPTTMDPIVEEEYPGRDIPESRRRPKPTQSTTTPAITEPSTLIPNEEEHSGNAGPNPGLIRPTTFQTTSVEPTVPPTSTTKTPDPITQESVPQDSDETLPVKDPTSPKTPVHHDDDDDDDDDDCCSCESCTEEQDPKHFKENACKNLEEARKELKKIFDKIRKKLKCGRKAPQSITTQAIS